MQFSRNADGIMSAVRQMFGRLHASRSLSWPCWLAVTWNQTMGASAFVNSAAKNSTHGVFAAGQLGPRGAGVRHVPRWAAGVTLLHRVSEVPAQLIAVGELYQSPARLDALAQCTHRRSLQYTSALLLFPSRYHSSVLLSPVTSPRRHVDPQERSHLVASMLAGQALTAALRVHRVQRCADVGARNSSHGRL